MIEQQVQIAQQREGEPVKLPRRRRKLRTGRAGLGVYIFLAAVVLISFFPFYWSLLIGSGDASTVRDPDRSWLPGGNFFANIEAVVINPAVNFWRALMNSIIVSTVVSLSVVFFSTLAGYAFAKFRFRGRGPLLVFVVATIAVPTQLGIVPLFIAMSDLGWVGTLTAVIVPNLVTAFGVFWMTQYIGQVVPDEMIESARIDGASTFQSFRLVVLPVLRPAATMLGLFTFVMSWTDFFWPYIVLNGENPTLPVSLQLLQSNYFIDYSIVLAGALLATIPLLLLFVVTGKQLVAGVMAGAVKG
ncbi:carbohydrate ABC transporter permease [Agreia sp.]|uniref:carbohydrate ABC transporter permease n=1 Tax=Agreia sp. TaxID=1872416 RepID=UPI0035BC7595